MSSGSETEARPAGRRRGRRIGLGALWLGLLGGVAYIGFRIYEEPEVRRPTEVHYEGPMIDFQGNLAPARVTGRFAPTNEGIELSWPGTAITVGFSGGALAAELTDTGDGRYLVLLDGRPLEEKLAVGPRRATVPLVEDLPAGEHTVTLYKLTEPLVGTTTIHSLMLERGNEFLPAPDPPARRIEIIGDSISAGYGNEGDGPDCSFSPDTENHYLTYGAITARNLNAELSTVAWSGKGVFSNRGDTVDTMPELWELAVPTEPRQRWPFPKAAPDAVVINLGTNDFAPEVRDTSPFAGAYERLLESVRQRYPEAHVFCTVGPLLSDHYPRDENALSTVRSVLERLVDKRRKRGLPVHFLEFDRVKEAEGLGCDHHPSVQTHQRMSQTLTRTLREVLRW